MENGNDYNGGGGTTSGTYVDQLHRVFSDCDTSGSGFLGRTELVELCTQLHLSDQSSLLLDHLLGDDPEAKVGFDEFKDKFVFLLAQSVQDDDGDDSDSESNDSDRRHLSSTSRGREVLPKYVWGSKKYGRRSRPDLGANDTDSDFTTDFSDSEVFIESAEAVLCNSSRVVVDGLAAKQRMSKITAGFAKRRRRMKSGEDRASSSSCIVDDTDEGEDNEEENYLRSIWLRHGVGTDGFLDRNGLVKVCEHIGMEKMCDEVVSLLFEKLDVDQDGRIYFGEFLHLFRSGNAVLTPESTMHDDKCQQKQADDLAAVHLKQTEATAGGESGAFSSIDPQSTGFADADVLLELWDSLGIADGYAILKELGIPANTKINLTELSNIFEDILQNPGGDPELTQVAFLSFVHDSKFLRKTIQQLKLERDFLKEDVADANSRATLIAQEVDENQAKLEKQSREKLINMGKKYQEKMRRLEDELESEQERWNEQFLTVKRSLQQEACARQEAQLKYEEQLLEMEKEIQHLICEKQKLAERLSAMELQRQATEQQPKPTAAAAAGTGEELEGRYVALLEDLERCRTINKQLQDRNDELNATVERLEARLWSARSHSDDDSSSSSSKCHRRSGSWLADYVNSSLPTDRCKGYSDEMQATVSDADSGHKRRRSGSDVADDEWSDDEHYLSA